MRVRHQGAILLGIPLVCQVVFALILVRNIGLLEEAGQREANAKAVISACQDMKAVMSRLIVQIVAKEFLSATEGKAIKKSVNEVINEKFKAVESLLKDDPTSLKLAQQFRDDLAQMSAVVADFDEVQTEGTTGNGKRVLARYLNNGEQIEEALVYAQRSVQDDEALMQRFRPVLEEWQPKALSEREHLRHNILIAIAFEVILSLSVAFWLGNRFLNRLKTLMSNIDKFSRGTTTLEKLDGNDELTELDEHFRQMAIARYEAEEFKASLMAMVAHDLRSPLSSSNIIIETILGKKEELTDWVGTRLNRLQSELQRLLRLANSLLDIERIESNKLELNIAPTTATDIAGVTFRAVEGAAKMTDIELVSNIETEADIYLDEDRIVQVLVNLISNSIRFAPKASQVTLHVSQKADGDQFLFEVFDHGPGVPEEERSKLFKKFSQTSQEQQLKKQGTGFGLYLTAMIVKAHGGSTGYRYSKEEGSCFYFEIPRTPIENLLA